MRTHAGTLLLILCVVLGSACSETVVYSSKDAASATIDGTSSQDIGNSSDAAWEDDALDLSDIHYATDIPDAQWGPGDAATGDVDCPYVYAIHWDLDSGALIRDRLLRCSEVSNQWDSGSYVCCRRQFIEHPESDETSDRSWNVICARRLDCRLGGRVP